MATLFPLGYKNKVRLYHRTQTFILVTLEVYTDGFPLSKSEVLASSLVQGCNINH